MFLSNKLYYFVTYNVNKSFETFFINLNIFAVPNNKYALFHLLITAMLKY